MTMLNPRGKFSRGPALAPWRPALLNPEGRFGAAGPPSLPYAPSVRIHPGSATMTRRADSSFSGYIIPQDSRGSILIVTSINLSANAGLRDPDIIYHASLPGGQARIIGIRNTSPGDSGTGQYLIDVVGQTTGSISSPVTFGLSGNQVVTVSDATGNTDGLTAPDGDGPILVDVGGRKGLLFRGNRSVAESWIRNTTLAGIDTHSFGVILVGQVLHPSNFANSVPMTASRRPFLGLGYPGWSGLNASTDDIGQFLGCSTGNFIRPAPWTLAAGGYTTAADLKRGILGAQTQVWGSFHATSDGYNGSSTSYTCETFVNEKRFSLSRTYTRVKNIQGFTLNHFPKSSGLWPTVYPGAGSYFLLFDAAIYGQGLGTSSELPARLDATIAAMMSAYGLVPVTKNLVCGGDSRFATYGSYYFAADGQGVAAICANNLPSYVRVTDYSIGGDGIYLMNAQSELQWSNVDLGMATALSAGYEFGGGNDLFVGLSGTNDPNQWPTVAGATGSNAQLDDLYSGNSGLGYSGTATATTGAINNKTVTLTSVTGYVINGALMNGGTWTPWAPGTALKVLTDLTTYQTTASISSSTTFTTIGYVPFYAKMLARGWKTIWCVEFPVSTPMVYFGDKIAANALTDLDALPGGANENKAYLFDGRGITVGGVTVLGAQRATYGDYYSDSVHWTLAGRQTVATGGDSFSDGLIDKIRTVLGVTGMSSTAVLMSSASAALPVNTSLFVPNTEMTFTHYGQTAAALRCDTVGGVRWYIDWGDKVVQEATSGATVSHTYGSATTRYTIRIWSTAAFTRFDSTSNAFAFDVGTDLPTTVTTLVVQGSNTLSGSVSALTGLTYLNVTGSNTLEMPTSTPWRIASMRYVSIGGQPKDQTFIDNTLIALSQVTSWTNEKQVLLNYPGNSAPSAAGLAAKAIIASYGVTVSVN
jgi:hypothetical protein